MSAEIIEFETYADSVPEILEKISAGRIIAEQEKILLKPNLVTDSPYPVTTSPLCCGAVIDHVRSCNPGAGIIIAEGTGDPKLRDMKIFDALGYTKLAQQKGVGLIDLNEEPTVRLENPQCKRFPEFYMPEIAMSCFIISLPVLKVHTLSDFTGTMKNMMGFAPPSHYSGGGWNKAAFHRGLQEAIYDLNRYRCADLSLMDAAVGMADSHLGGRKCDPPAGKLVAGYDPVAVDRICAELLGLDWKKIGHLEKDLQEPF
ncbi:MAG: DUF362 domain-containing protein [Desulfosalsimonas sp.]